MMLIHSQSDPGALPAQEDRALFMLAKPKAITYLFDPWIAGAYDYKFRKLPIRQRDRRLGIAVVGL